MQHSHRKNRRDGRRARRGVYTVQAADRHHCICRLEEPARVRLVHAHARNITLGNVLQFRLQHDGGVLLLCVRAIVRVAGPYMASGAGNQHCAVCRVRWAVCDSHGHQPSKVVLARERGLAVLCGGVAGGVWRRLDELRPRLGDSGKRGECACDVRARVLPCHEHERVDTPL